MLTILTKGLLGFHRPAPGPTWRPIFVIPIKCLEILLLYMEKSGVLGGTRGSQLPFTHCFWKRSAIIVCGSPPSASFRLLLTCITNWENSCIIIRVRRTHTASGWVRYSSTQHFEYSCLNNTWKLSTCTSRIYIKQSLGHTFNGCRR